MLQVFAVAILTLAIVGLVLGLQARHHTKKKARHQTTQWLPRGPVIAMLASLIAAGCALVWVWIHISRAPIQAPAPPRPPPPEETAAMYRTAGLILGNFVADNYSDATVIVLLPPKNRMDAVDYATLTALSKRVQADLTIKKIHLPETNEIEQPLYNPSPEAFDEIMRQQEKSDVVISLTGLPAAAEALDFWNAEAKPELILMNTAAVRLKHLIMRGDIDALLIRHPQAVGQSFAPASPRNWLLATPQNIDRIAERFPNLFARRDTEKEPD